MFLQRFLKIGAAYQQAKRLRHVAAVLLKYGYGDLARHLPLPRADRLPFRRVRVTQKAVQRMTPAERVRRVCEELGPTFVKLGQLAAARTRVLPPEYIAELAKLQDQASPLPYADIVAILNEELPLPPEQVFAAIEETPLASASIAQVHRARLLTGEEVVLKVQRPGIVETVEEDFAILRHLAELAEVHLPGWRLHRPVALIDELIESLRKEMDFTCEAAHLERFAWQFREEAGLHVPVLYRDFTTPRLLVLEYIDGIKVSDHAALQAVGIDCRVLSVRIADLVMKQVFEFGFFHADPHPGNLHILPDQRICFLDFGMMGFLDLRTREAFVDFVWAIARHNEASAATALLKLTENQAEPVRGPFEADVAEFMHAHFYRPAGELRFASVVSQLSHLATKHGLRLPSNLVLMLKAISVMEQLVRELNPEYDLILHAQPFMKRTRLGRLRPRRMILGALEFAQEMTEVARDLPQELRRFATQVKGGHMRIKFHHEGLEPAAHAFERAVNRLSFAVVVAALVIGSSLIIHAKVPPLWGDVSALGLFGYLLAGFLGFWMLVGILRHGKM
ncbi:2-octaprenylphenol hydroxylase [Verrucomicrobium sp. GAS474]|uniref:ABC1 kinase family protein n=1 Tax=Verrucomicrobium sp. GAS474 TaxID=1882831 RepID=UPI00087BA27B|nr:AarF/ABC1/UbiB kinase family protein [Verrucomicrobium sp. GAS474]SDT92493.1 2-octaprenylphenol hydroxylase [Verrucomicrobium sp. GAS474]